jgi:ribosomal protein S18 acetylase RimI-like enzyme
MLSHNVQLEPHQLTELDALCTLCKMTDGNIIPIYKHLISKHRPTSRNLSYYQHGKLVGFLSAFFFYEDACEMTVIVAPASRRQGIATLMLKDILPLLYAYQVNTLIFSTPSDLNNKWLTAHGFCYKYSEYQMRKKQDEPIKITNEDLTIRLATETDIPDLYAIDSICFAEDQPVMTMHFHNLLQNPSCKLFIAEKEGEIIGKAHIHQQEDSTRLTDIAILPHLQRCGFGSTLLAHCINYCLSNHLPNINLDVETTNKRALSIYTRLGFVINNAYDFWTIPINNILQQ